MLRLHPYITVWMERGAVNVARNPVEMDDGRPDPHASQQVDRRGPAGPGRRRSGRRPDRAAGPGARRYPGRLLLALQRPWRAARGDTRFEGSGDHRGGGRAPRPRGWRRPGQATATARAHLV